MNSFRQISTLLLLFPIILVPPKPPVIRVHRVTSNSITLRWTNGDIGNSPIIAYRIKYKITYGEWAEKLVRALLNHIHPRFMQDDWKKKDLISANISVVTIIKEVFLHP